MGDAARNRIRLSRRGGGRPDLAQAGGKNTEKLGEAIAQAPEIIAQSLCR